MKKGKFASLMMLSAFSAGVASSSAVSAQGNENLASVVDNKSASSHDDSVSIDPKVSKESAVAFDETKIDTETTTDEETQDDSTDGSSNERNDVENLDKNIENKTDLPQNLDKEDNEDRNFAFTDGTKRGKENKEKKIKIAKGAIFASGGAIVTGGTVAVANKLLKSYGDGKENNVTIDQGGKKTDDENKNDKTPTEQDNNKQGVGENRSNKTNTESSGLLIGAYIFALCMGIILILGALYLIEKGLEQNLGINNTNNNINQ